MRILTTAIAAALLPVPALAQTQTESPDFYARVQARIVGDPALMASLGRPAAQMAEVQWLVGEWDVVGTAEVGPNRQPQRGNAEVTTVWGGIWLEMRSASAIGVQDTAYLGYSAASKRWTFIRYDNLGNANVQTSAGWQDGRMVFEGDVSVLGVAARLRQIVTREGDDAFRVENDEFLDGKWKRLDSYRYTRSKPS